MSSHGQGLFLLGTVARETGSPSRTYENLDSVTSQLAEEVIESAVENHNADLYPAAFVGELLYQTYEKRRLERETAAVHVIETWYCDMVDALREAFSRRMIRKLVQQAEEQQGEENERSLAASIILHWYRAQSMAFLARHTRRRRATARSVVRDALEVCAAAQEEEYYQHAAGQIQRCTRQWIAKRTVELRRAERQAMYQHQRELEAREVIHRSLRAHNDKLHYARAKKLRLEQERIQVQREAVTTIQTKFRGWRQRRAYHKARGERRDRAACCVQRAVRRFLALRLYHQLYQEAELTKRRNALNEAAIVIQSNGRRMVQRKKYLLHRAAMRATPILQRIGRGYLSRFTVQSFWQRALATTSIQSLVRGFLARRLCRKKRQQREASRQRAYLDHAARTIQRAWRFFAAKIALERRRIEHGLEVAAARTIQFHARMWVAKIQLQNLRYASEDAAFDRLVHRSAVTIQANVRGWMVRHRVKEIRSRLQQAGTILLDTANSYLSRRELGRLYNRYRCNICAVKIQRAYRYWIALRMADRRHHMRVAYIRGVRQRDMAAVTIQCAYRRFSGRRAYLLLQRRRHRGATKIQTQVRMMFARAILDVMLEERHRELAARRIQMMWLHAAPKFRQRREIQTLELELLKMEHTSLVRKEAAMREQVTKEEHDWWCREQFRFQTNWERLREAYAKRLAEWKRANPVERQVEAATTIQASIRGLLSRRKNLDQEDEYKQAEALLDAYDAAKTQPKEERRWSLTDLARGLRAVTATTDTTEEEESPSVTPRPAGGESDRPLSPASLALGYHSWAAFAIAHRAVLGYDGLEVDQFSSSKFRTVERLLARETNARRNMIEEQDTVRALLWAKATVPPNAHLRPLLAVAKRPVIAFEDTESLLSSKESLATPPPLTLAPLRCTYPPTEEEMLRQAHTANTMQAVRGTYRNLALDIGRPNLLGSNKLKKSPRNTNLLITEHATTHNQQEDNEEETVSASSTPRTHVVDLRSKGLTEQQLRVVLAALRSHSTVTSLLLDGNALGDASCRDLADALPRIPTLQQLALCGWNVTDTGITHIISTLKRLMDQTSKATGMTTAPTNTVKCALVSVDLRDTLVTEPYRTHLAAILQRNAEMIEELRVGAEEGREMVPGLTDRNRWAAGLRTLPPKEKRATALAPLRSVRPLDRVRNNASAVNIKEPVLGLQDEDSGYRQMQM